MIQIKLNYEDRKFFHPRPSWKQDEMIKAIISKLDWKVEVPANKFGRKELTREEAKELISKGIKAAKRKGIYLLEK